MKALISILFILTFYTLKGNNNQTITGHVTDYKKNDLIAVTVCCFVNDSTFVKGCTTNSKGEFKLEVPQNNKIQRLVFTYLGYKDLVINIQPCQETTIRLGDLIMKKDAIQIHEVTVLGESQVRTEDKLMVYPTKEELRHAYDGFSALDALMIPGLNVNTFDHSVNYMNQNVLFCIDGREATQDEVRDLNAKYIKRVDLYSAGKPEFPQAGTVIDYVMKERDYAGTVAFNANHHLTHLEGDGRVNTQYYQGKSEFAVSASGTYNDYRVKEEGYTQTVYNFPNETITRTLRNLPSEDNAYKLNGYANYIYRDKVQDFYASLRTNHSDSEKDNWNSLQYNNDPTLLTTQEERQMKQFNPGLKLQYTRKLSHNQRLRAELYGSYGNNDYDRWYEHREDETIVDAYRNSTDEESYYGSGKINYTKTFKNRSSLNIDLSQDLTHTDNLNLRGENTYNVSLNKSNTRLNVTYNHRIKNRLNLQARLAGHVSHVKTGDNKVTNYFFTPSIRLSYVYKNHSFEIKGAANSREASNSNRTGDEYRNNEYEITQGNPDLKDYMNYFVNLTHVWNINKHFTWLCFAEFAFNTNYIYKNCYYDESRNSLIWKYKNSGANWGQHYEAAIQWNILPKRLFIRTGLLCNYRKVNIWKTVYHHGLYATGSIVYQYKGFRTLINLLTGPEMIEPQTGYITRNATKLTLNASYSINNWNFAIAYYNPYKAKKRDNLDLGIYQEYSISRKPRISDNYGTITVSYRFNYGKKKHKFDNTEVIDINQTTISQ